MIFQASISDRNPERSRITLQNLLSADGTAGLFCAVSVVCYPSWYRIKWIYFTYKYKLKA
jgi:hypothetical protein